MNMLKNLFSKKSKELKLNIIQPPLVFELINLENDGIDLKNKCKTQFITYFNKKTDERYEKLLEKFKEIAKDGFSGCVINLSKFVENYLNSGNYTISDINCKNAYFAKDFENKLNIEQLNVKLLEKTDGFVKLEVIWSINKNIFGQLINVDEL